MLGSRSAYTRQRILDTAARLFAQKGDAVSLREITTAARVNLSSVNYHFGSKEGLIQAIHQQRLNTLCQEQLTKLKRLEAHPDGGASPDPLKVVEAYFKPLLRHILGGTTFSPTGEPQLTTDPNALICALTRNENSEVLGYFHATLRKALPDTPEYELLWRVLFMLGAASYCALSVDGLAFALNHSSPEPADTESLADRLMLFLVGGLLAPVPCYAAEGLSTEKLEGGNHGFQPDLHY
ncbi:MAG: TetR/AcrR family transcriptional regulator [Alcaligenaceae bacterium]|nr:TetR/AcrR family transcriptional regulator [Alcaligenaceae bacterium]